MATPSSGPTAQPPAASTPAAADPAHPNVVGSEATPPHTSAKGTAPHTAPYIGPVSASAPAASPDAMGDIARALGPGPFAQVMLFADPAAPFEALAQTRLFGGARVIGCSTAGEITKDGYVEGQINAMALPADLFEVEEILISPLPTPQATGEIPAADRFDPRDLVFRILRARQSLARARPEWTYEFAFMLVDGLSGSEDALAAAVAGGLGPVPLFGGSAGDGTRFGRTRIISGGEVLENAAVLTLVRTKCPVQVFSLDNLEPTPSRMVVTKAAPERRAVLRINDEPAAHEYARLLSLPPDHLTSFTFASNPVLVRAGGRHHVRAIQRADPAGEMIFFSAIDEGLVLTLARPQDIAAHLDGELTSLAGETTPSAILACDCIFRRMEAEERQSSRAVSEILARHNVTGFSTYGEQIGAMHVNQTMTGIAFYPPRSGS